MDRGLRAPLSPNEEITLRRVAHGVSHLREMSRRDLQHLKQLSLIVDVRGQPELTDIGRKRYRLLSRTPLTSVRAH
jgi:hypothetical protein